MNAAVTIMQSVDWTRFDLEGWLYQFGAWMNSVSGTCGKTVNPIAVAMDSAVKAQKYKKLTKEQQQQIVVDYLTGDFEPPKARRSKLTCQIDDNEARAVQRLILDMQGKSAVLDEWLEAVVDRYFYGSSWPNMVIKIGRVENPTIIRSEMDARFDVKCGLAALHSQYQFIKYKTAKYG